LYQTDDGGTEISLRAIDGTVWLTQNEIAELFGNSRSTIVEHIQNILIDAELVQHSVCRNFRRTAADGKGYDVSHYNLDMILAVGYRVRSARGVKFRKWVNTIFKDCRYSSGDPHNLVEHTFQIEKPIDCFARNS